jgi:hypothetical protein
VVTEHTQNKAQFGRAGNLGPRNLTASGISHREIGHWVVWITDSENTLGEIVKLLQQNADLKLRVEGHTDNQGNAAANQALSERRAQAVVAWLTAHGVAASRLSAKGMAQTKPVADNSGDESRAKNRRVELVKQ